VPLPRYPASERSAEEALRDTDDFFAGEGPVHSMLRRLAARLDREDIPYAIIGAMGTGNPSRCRFPIRRLQQSRLVSIALSRSKR
jgi:hypothetical protein